MSLHIKPFIVEQLSNSLFDSVLNNVNLSNVLIELRSSIDDNQHEIYDNHTAKYMRRMTYKLTVGLGDSDRRYVCSYIICVLCKVYNKKQ